MAITTYKTTNNTTPTYGENSASVGALQTQLNTQNAGKAGWVPLTVDNKYGDKTLAATKFGVATDPSNVNNTNDANSYINGNQANDFNTKTNTSGDNPPVKSSTQTYTEMFNNLKASIAPTTAKTETPNFTDQYKNLLSTSGITDLETELNTYKDQAKGIQDLNTAQTYNEQGKPVAMNVINGRMSQEQQDNQLKLDAINRNITRISDQLTTKYNTVNTLMTYGKLDYQNAVDNYDKQFTQNLNLFNTVKGIAEADKSEADKVADNARANLQIIYNNISSNAADPSTLTADEKANITKLETQAGLPVGFYSSLQAKNPKSDILSTTTRDANGTKYADIILKNADGSLSTKSVVLGSVDKSGSGSTDVKTQGFTDINAILDNPNATTTSGEPVRDTNGFITPAGLKQIIKYGVTQKISRAEILAQYASDLYKDEDYAGYGLTPAEISKLAY